MSLAFAIVTQALGITEQIYNSEVTADYRGQVLDGIQKIEQGLAAIQDQLGQILAQTKLNHLAIETGGADGKINEYYSRDEIQAWLKGSKDPLPADLQGDITGPNGVRDLLTSVHDAILGTLTGQDEPWLQIFIESAGAIGYLGTSKCELAYHFFATYLIPMQLRGLALLAAAGALGDFKQTWDDKLKAQGKKCQEITGSVLSRNDLWWLRPAGEGDDLQSFKIFWGYPSYPVPPGEVLVGYKFVVDGDGVAMLKLGHGAMNGYGSVETIAYDYSRGNEGLTGDTADSYYLYMGPLELEEGWVVTNMAFFSCGSFWSYAEHPNTVHYYGVVPALYATQLRADGTLDDGTSKWVTPQVNFPGGEQDVPRHSRLDLSGASFFWVGDFGGNYTAPLLAPPGVATPMTGVQFDFDGRSIVASAKLTLHQHCYDPDAG